MGARTLETAMVPQKVLENATKKSLKTARQVWIFSKETPDGLCWLIVLVAGKAKGFDYKGRVIGDEFFAA
jgi:hypothetical protein